MTLLQLLAELTLYPLLGTVPHTVLERWPHRRRSEKGGRSRVGHQVNPVHRRT